jgi:hypothetical protein
MNEPGVDLHELESIWASIEEDEVLDPEDALSRYADLVQQMPVTRGCGVFDTIVEERP